MQIDVRPVARLRGVESARDVGDRIKRGLEFVPAERLALNPDCGLRHLPTEVARAKLRALVAGAQLVRAELTATKSTTRARSVKTTTGFDVG
jgi:5-methyltetrahydropteroyltriglutamate--homocysteine methyltransferase